MPPLTVDFAVSTKPQDLRTATPYKSLRLPTIGDSVNPGNCGTNATMGNVKVLVNGVPNNDVSGLSPTPGAPGTQVTITGTDFGTTQSAVSVTVNGVNAVITGWSSTSITVMVPNYDYATHVDSRIPDPRCAGLQQGTTFSQKVMADIVNTYYKIKIPERGSTGNIVNGNDSQPIVRSLQESDQYVSVEDVIDFANDSLNWYDPSKPPKSVKQLDSGAINFGAQFSLASSYGDLQVLYTSAIDMSSIGGQWTGNTAACDASSLMDPDNLFDTDCNYNNGGGSLNVGTRMTERNFARAWGSSPSVADESSFENQFFVSAFQQYNLHSRGYGASVISKRRSFEPTPNGAIFTTGGQQ